MFAGTLVMSTKSKRKHKPSDNDCCRGLRVFAGAHKYQCRPTECSRSHESASRGHNGAKNGRESAHRDRREALRG